MDGSRYRSWWITRLSRATCSVPQSVHAVLCSPCPLPLPSALCGKEGKTPFIQTLTYSYLASRPCAVIGLLRYHGGSPMLLNNALFFSSINWNLSIRYRFNLTPIDHAHLIMIRSTEIDQFTIKSVLHLPFSDFKTKSKKIHWKSCATGRLFIDITATISQLLNDRWDLKRTVMNQSNFLSKKNVYYSLRAIWDHHHLSPSLVDPSDAVSKSCRFKVGL